MGEWIFETLVFVLVDGLFQQSTLKYWYEKVLLTVTTVRRSVS